VPPLFLTLKELLEIHRDQVEHYGGESGLRDMDLLQSALAMPAAGLGGRHLHTDLFEMAAAYLFHLVQNHPFLDGNKRTGAVAALVFLALNNVTIKADEDDYELLVLDVARGKADKPVIAEFFRKHSKPLSAR